jgi:hypothetical protein|tara:strand:+ start:1715 stop:1846 length:132 start_codon:yes stop_codon:yes gene_type:complete
MVTPGDSKIVAACALVAIVLIPRAFEKKTVWTFAMGVDEPFLQ